MTDPSPPRISNTSIARATNGWPGWMRTQFTAWIQRAEDQGARFTTAEVAVTWWRNPRDRAIYDR